jgi:hypothetical protein
MFFVTLSALAEISQRFSICVRYTIFIFSLLQYGKQLRENYRAFKNKQTESINPKDYNSYTVPNVSTHFVPIFFPSLRGIRSRASF